MLRILAYSLTLLLSILTTVTLLYVALGYRFDSGHVVQNGLLLVNNQPVAARIMIDNIERDNAAPGRFVLPAGEYQLRLTRDEYRDWEKQIEVTPGRVRTVHYPILIPEKLNSNNVRTLQSPYLMSQSLDKKLLLVHSENAPAFELISLGGDAAAHAPEILSFPVAMPQENNQFGTFTVIEWALNNKQVLLEQTLPSGAKNLLSYDVSRPAEMINITALYQSQTPSNVHYVGGKTSFIYGIHEGILQRYNLERAEISPLLSQVRQYHPYGDTTFVFDRIGESGIELGVWKDEEVTVLHTYTSNIPITTLQYFYYDNHFYFAFTHPDKTEVIVYRDPIKKPILAKQLPFLKIQSPVGSSLSVSPSSQFLLIAKDAQLITYDFENTQKYSFSPSLERAPETKVRWVTGEHLQFQGEDGRNYLMEYDGANQEALLVSNIGSPALFTDNMESMYSIVSAQDALQLRMTSMIVE